MAVGHGDWHCHLLTSGAQEGPGGTLLVAIAAGQDSASVALGSGVVLLAVRVEAWGVGVCDGQRAEILLILPLVYRQLHIVGRQVRDDVVVTPEHIQDGLSPTEGPEGKALAPLENDASVHSLRTPIEGPVPGILGPRTIVAFAPLVLLVQVRDNLVAVDGDVQDLLVDLVESLQIFGIKDVAILSVHVVAGDGEEVEPRVRRIGLRDVIVMLQGNGSSGDPLLLRSRLVRKHREPAATGHHEEDTADETLDGVSADDPAHFLEEAF